MIELAAMNHFPMSYEDTAKECKAKIKTKLQHATKGALAKAVPKLLTNSLVGPRSLTDIEKETEPKFATMIPDSRWDNLSSTVQSAMA